MSPTIERNSCWGALGEFLFLIHPNVNAKNFQLTAKKRKRLDRLSLFGMLYNFALGSFGGKRMGAENSLFIQGRMVY